MAHLNLCLRSFKCRISYFLPLKLGPHFSVPICNHCTFYKISACRTVSTNSAHRLDIQLSKHAVRCKHKNFKSLILQFHTPSCRYITLSHLRNFYTGESVGQCSHTAAESNSKPILSMCPSDFVEFLKSRKLNRCSFIWSDASQRIESSHPELKEIEDWFNDPSNPQYKRHEAVFISLGMRTNCLLGAFLWKVRRGQACGGIRMTPYSSVESFICEGLRLSRRLGVKAALAGLWIGGGKGLISEPKDRQHIQPEFRQKIFYDYGDFVSSLNGCFIAGMDTGVNTFDLYNVHSRTRWVICGPEDIGGSGNAAALLGRGIICAMEAALSFLHAGDLNGKKVAVQGAGGIGLALVSSLLDHGVNHVYVTDTSKQSIRDLHDAMISRARGRLKVEHVPAADVSILRHECDILALCAMGHVLKPETIPDIRAKIVCGSANALLSNEEWANSLAERDVTYVLEYLPNRMAVVSSAYENYGRLYKDPLIERHFDKDWEHSIYYLTQKTLKMASDKSMNVVEAAYQLADEYSEQQHPLWPQRTKTIIESLQTGQWHNGQDFWRKRRNFAKADDCSQS